MRSNRMKAPSFRAIAQCLAALAFLLPMISGCEAPDPNANTPTSGRLIVYTDEIYAPLIKTLADTFMLRSPNAKVDVRAVPARAGVQALLDAVGRDTSSADTGTTYAIVIGRKLLSDEQDAMVKGGLDVKEYVIAHDGVAVVVPTGSSLRYGTIENLRRALATSGPSLSMLDSSAGDAPLRFLLPDQNSSTYAVVHGMLGAGKLTAPAYYFAAGDSVLNGVVEGKGIGILGWYPAHRDSVRTRTLPLGYIDTLGKAHPAAAVHPTSLVTGAYPFKQPLVGYTFSGTRSLAVGFLAWLSKSQDAQYYLANHGLQPENVKIRIVLPEEE